MHLMQHLLDHLRKQTPFLTAKGSNLVVTRNRRIIVNVHSIYSRPLSLRPLVLFA